MKIPFRWAKTRLLSRKKKQSPDLRQSCKELVFSYCLLLAMACRNYLRPSSLQSLCQKNCVSSWRSYISLIIIPLRNETQLSRWQGSCSQLRPDADFSLYCKPVVCFLKTEVGGQVLTCAQCSSLESAFSNPCLVEVKRYNTGSGEKRFPGSSSSPNNLNLFCA